MSDKYFITTAIDYPNGTPHMGHAYEKIVTDFYARYYKMNGKDSYFLTGTDENGQKLKTTAQKNNQETLPFVDKNVEVFKKLCSTLNISHNDFIRTTEKRHIDTVHEIWSKLVQKELIYLSEYTGFYCDDCESFYTEKQLDEGNKCPYHHKELPQKTEKGYFFKLSHFQDWLINFHNENPDYIVPSTARKEVISRINDEIRDLSISRPNQGWGIEVPGNSDYVIYTWFDALINYYSAVAQDQKDLWPADCHVIGRDITWFHCVIWPSILKAADIEAPKQVYVHGMILAEDGKKMSKSLGNGVDPLEIISKFGLESFRYYLLKSIPSHSNGRFSEEGLIKENNASLANDYGNLLMRAVKLTMRKVGSKFAYNKDFEIENDYQELRKLVDGYVKEFEHDKAIKAIWKELQAVNQYINEKEPWAIKETNNDLLTIFFNCLYSIHCLSYLLYPAIPETVVKTLDILGHTMERNPFIDKEQLEYNLTDPKALFSKF